MGCTLRVMGACARVIESEFHSPDREDATRFRRTHAFWNRENPRHYQGKRRQRIEGIQNPSEGSVDGDPDVEYGRRETEFGKECPLLPASAANVYSTFSIEIRRRGTGISTEIREFVRRGSVELNPDGNKQDRRSDRDVSRETLRHRSSIYRKYRFGKSVGRVKLGKSITGKHEKSITDRPKMQEAHRENLRSDKFQLCPALGRVRVTKVRESRVKSA